jgi:hypothetical protein
MNHKEIRIKETEIDILIRFYDDFGTVGTFAGIVFDGIEIKD